MFTVRNIIKAYGARTILNDVSLTIRHGERLAIIGPNGTGKTTLLRILAGESSADSGEIVTQTGSVIGYLRQETDPNSTRTVLEETLEGAGQTTALARRIESLEAEISATTDSALLEVLTRQLGHLHSQFQWAGGYRLEAEARTILSGLGFAENQHCLPLASFSGGWQMRVALARLLLNKPDLLLLDEPTNHLDLESLIWFESVLLSYAGAIILISHDREFMNRIATRVSELRRGQLEHYSGNYDRYLEEKEKREEILEAARANQERHLAETQRFIDRFRYKATKARQVQSRIRQLEKVEWVDVPTDTPGMHAFTFPKTERCGKEVIRLSDVDKSYSNRIIYSGLDLTLHKEEKIALVGPNGAGKSTLLKLLSGRIQADRGEVRLGDKVSRAYYAQHTLELLDPSRTPLEEIQRAAPAESPARLRDLLGAFLISGDDALRPVSTLSGGEKARLVLACLLARPANLLLMDEPTNHLDIASRGILEDALRQYDGTLCLITHDRHLIRTVANRIIEVGNGQAVLHATDYEGYLYRKSLESDRMGTSGSPSSDPENTSPKRGREQRRALGNLRTRYYEATRTLKADIERIEIEIDDLDRRKKALEDALTQPEVYASGSRVSEIREELRAIGDRSSDLTSRWESASAELETIESAFKAEEESLRLQC